MRDQWKQHDEAMRLLPGPTIERDQELPQAILESRTGGAAPSTKVTLVFFIGGITFTEISAIRYLSQVDGLYSPVGFLIPLTLLLLLRKHRLHHSHYQTH